MADRAVQYYNEGVSFAKLGQYAEAVDSCDKAIAIKPDLYEAWFNRGNALAQLGRHAEALASHDKAIAINPNDAIAWYNRGVSLYKLGRDAEAVASYDKAIAINPDHTPRRGASADSRSIISEGIQYLLPLMTRRLPSTQMTP